MVALDFVKASNASIPQNLPSDLVAVFVGGTSGVGEATLTLFTKSTRRPRIYIVGRSRDAAERIITKCRIDNSEGSYSFIQKDLDLMSNVEEVCEEISGREEAINLLFLSAGGPDLSRSSMFAPFKDHGAEPKARLVNNSEQKLQRVSTAFSLLTTMAVSCSSNVCYLSCAMRLPYRVSSVWREVGTKASCTPPTFLP
jgi:NAD(P)-dependent dehydrogenase (short-subunit alcohol dehydrogenase family)